MTEKSGFYLITKGKCKVLNHDDKYYCKSLQGGDYFGESDILKSIGFEFFGDIYVESDDFECLFIAKDDFMKLPLFELMGIRDHATSRDVIKMLGYEYSTKYKIDSAEYDSYYWILWLNQEYWILLYIMKREI